MTRADAGIVTVNPATGAELDFYPYATAGIPAAAVVRSRFLNNGQSCVAAKRILVHRAVRDEFVDAMVPHVKALTVGDPANESCDVGPLARHDLRDLLREQRRQALAAGGRVLAEAPAPDDGLGAWCAPSVVEVAGPASVLFSQETFGPLGALTAGSDDNELIALANSSRYGLSCSIWSGDSEHAAAVGALIQAGAVFVNTISATDPRLPTGGVKASGYGRELGRWGVHELANVQAWRIRNPAVAA